MTISYTTKISNATFCGFSRLLLRWRGSVFKLVWLDLVVYLFLYSLISFLYRFGLGDDEKRIFERIALSCKYFRDVFEISFVLGFYVKIIVDRWWDQYMLIPWPDTACILASSYIQGLDERGQYLRKTFARYINLAFCLTFSRLSPSVAKRFNTYDRMIEEGYMTRSEKAIYEKMDNETKHHKIWMALTWASLVVVKARKEGRVTSDLARNELIKEVTKLRYNCGKLLEFHTMSIPLVYTQVVTMATYTYFFFSLLERQYLDPEYVEERKIDIYVPVISILEFIFYVGWLKVAESLLNPFGDDDDDFDIEYLLDRHFIVSYMIVDVMHKVYPDVLQDNQWDDARLPVNLSNERVDPENDPLHPNDSQLYPVMRMLEAENTPPSPQAGSSFFSVRL